MPRLIDGSPVALSSVESSNSIGMSYSVVSERQRTRCRKTRSDIIEEYHGINEEDKAFHDIVFHDRQIYLSCWQKEKGSHSAREETTLPNSF